MEWNDTKTGKIVKPTKDEIFGTLKPIETRYKSYRFRSRLEARWAVFFDSVGILWEYEKEGYNLGDGDYYLPDFWLPQVEMWAEVKPGDFGLKELIKVYKLAKGTGYSVICLTGVPEVRSYDVICPDETEYDVALTNHHGYLTDEERFYSCPYEDECEGFDDLVEGVLAAKQARFEHGETP